MQFLDQIILSWGETQPSKVAIIYRDQDLTYGQLKNRVRALAAGLKLAGVKEGDFVATLLEPGLDITAALLAIGQVGAIYAPLDPEHPDEQLQERLEDIQASLIVTQSSLRERVSELNVPFRLVDQLLHEGAISRMKAVESQRQPGDPACIFFTSGTTGKAKGAIATYEGHRNSIIEPVADLGLTGNDTLNSIARYAWSISMLELLGPLVVGGTSLILDRAAALNFDELYEWARKCTAFHCPPALLKRFSEYLQSQGSAHYMENIGVVWYGGDTFSIDAIKLLQQVFPAARVGTAYGCTEIFGLSHVHWYMRDPAPEKVLIGKPVGEMRQLLLDANRNPVAAGEEGEILLGGNRVAAEYWQRPDLNAEKFVQVDGVRYYLTGDFGRLDETGSLQYMERRDAQVKIRGIRIELGEVEQLLFKSASLKDAVVLAFDLESGERELRAFVVFNDGVMADVSGLRDKLREIAPDYLMPAMIQVLDAVPLTENFKVDRKALMEFRQEQTQSAALEDELARQVAELWLKAARVTVRSSHDNFFDVGGNSLTAALLATILGREFKRRVEVADIYRMPVLAEQCQWLRQAPVVVNRTEASGPIYAAEGQKGLIFRELFEKRDGSITCTRYIKSEVGFDDQLLRKAMLQLVERYPTLCTNIKFEKRNMLLVDHAVTDESTFSIKRKAGVWSVTGVGAPALEKHSLRFDVKGGPLIAGIISKLVDGTELLQLTAHHIAADDNSMGRLAKDFIALYDALVKHSCARLAEVNARYEDFVVDQRTRIESGEFNDVIGKISQQLERHHQKFLNEPLLQQADPGKSLALERPIEHREIAFSVYVAALAWAMSRCFGRHQFVFCVHAALQRDSDEDPRVGMFVNLLPLFLSLDVDGNASQCLQRTKEAFEQAMMRSSVPFEQLLASSESLRRLGHYPFDAFVNELHFGDQYQPGYSDVIVPRNFSSGTREISMSVLHLAGATSVKFESPNFGAGESMLENLSDEINAFLNQVDS